MQRILQQKNAHTHIYKKNGLKFCKPQQILHGNYNTLHDLHFIGFFNLFQILNSLDSLKRLFNICVHELHTCTICHHSRMPAMNR